MPPLPLHHLDLGSGPPIVFLHGWGMAGEVWDRQLTAFAGRHRCIALDLRGHGASPKPVEGYAYEDHVGDVVDLLTRLGATDALLVGWSMGGAVAARVAAALPETRGLALVGSPVSLLARPGFPHGATPVDAASFRAAIAESREQTFLQVARETCFAEVGEGVQAWLLSLLLRVPTWAAARSFDGVIAADVRDTVTGLDLPLLVLHGAHDAYVPLGAARWVASHARDATLVEFGDCGHAPFLEATHRFDDELGRFAARLLG